MIRKSKMTLKKWLLKYFSHDIYDTIKVYMFSYVEVTVIFKKKNKSKKHLNK